MRRFRQVALSYSLGLALLGTPVQADEPSTGPPPSAAGWRVSALLQFSGGVRAGIVDEVSNAVFFIGVGEKKHGAELLSANFDTEELVFRKDGVTWRLHLAADPTAAARIASDPNTSSPTGPISPLCQEESSMRDLACGIHCPPRSQWRD